MSINPLFNPNFFETALGRARPISFEMDLARARRILGSWTPLKRLTSDEAEIIVRMIAQGIGEGRRHGWEMAEVECPTVRSAPVNGHSQDRRACLKGATSRH